MPYTIRKRKCKQSSGKSGSFVLSYVDKKGKAHSACHTSRKKAKGQIAAIEMESVRLFVREVIAEEALGLHGAGMSEKDLASRLGFGGIELNKGGSVTDEEADAVAKKIANDKPERVYAYSRGAAVLSKAALDDDIENMPPVTYVAPAALRQWTDAPIPGVPGGSITIIGDKDAAVPVKQACQIAKQAGTPLYVYPGKSHVSILYTHGEVGGDAYEIDPTACAEDPELPDWGKSGNASKDQLAKQQELTPTYAKGAKPKSEGTNRMKLTLAELRSIIRETIQQNMKQGSLVSKTERELDEDEFTYAIAKAAEKGDKTADVGGEKFPVKMSKEKAKDILGKDKKQK